jgi:hypothetical protein
VLVVTGASNIGALAGHDVYRVAPSGVQCLPFASSLDSLTPKLQREERSYLRLLARFFRDAMLFFSFTLDLTSSAQRQASWAAAEAAAPIWPSCARQFLWNDAIATPFVLAAEAAGGAMRFVLPMISGHVGVAEGVRLGGGERLGFGVISRRSKFRAGTRLHTRGLNRAGAPANFVETEQLAWVEQRLCSFVQARGSVPVPVARHLSLACHRPDVHLQKVAEGGGGAGVLGAAAGPILQPTVQVPTKRRRARRPRRLPRPLRVPGPGLRW